MSSSKEEPICPDPSGVVTRFSIQQLQFFYDSGYKQPLEDVITAFRGIMKLPPKKLFSFFNLSGYHGAPFIDREGEKRDYWGGYCNHGNVLFPTWHRAYLHLFEKALQSIVPHVGLPFLDEGCHDLQTHGLPKILTMRKIEIGGEEVDNPLFSYKFQDEVDDTRKNIDVTVDADYSKPEGYESVRYPYTGLASSEKIRQESKEFNDSITPEDGTKLLNANVKAWLAGMNNEKEGVYKNAKEASTSPTVTVFDLTPDNPNPTQNGVHFQYTNCLTSPNYTVFSNKTSANDYFTKETGYVFSLESAHDAFHVAIGGLSIGSVVLGQQKGANGDMGETNTAAFDPIFWLHHCFVDHMFWIWQVRNNATKEIEIDPKVKGTKSEEATPGPAVGQDYGESLTVDSPLHPFKKENGKFMTSKDVLNIEDLGYRYGPGSFEEYKIPRHPSAPIPAHTGPKVCISGISRDKYLGSFVLYVRMLLDDGKDELLSPHVVFSRFDMDRCRNCQNHKDTQIVLPLGPKSTECYKKKAEMNIQISCHARSPSHGRHDHIHCHHSEIKWSIID